MAHAPAKRTFSKRVVSLMWAVGIFFSIGYLPTLLLGLAPPVSMVLAAMAAIPYGSKARSVRRGIFRGAGVGLIAGFSLFSAMQSMMQMPAQAGEPDQPTTAPMVATAPATTSAPATAPVAEPTPLPPGMAARLGVYCIGVTMLMCAASAGLFAHLKQRRLRRIEDEWRRHQ